MNFINFVANIMIYSETYKLFITFFLSFQQFQHKDLKIILQILWTSQTYFVIRIAEGFSLYIRFSRKHLVVSK